MFGSRKRLEAQLRASGRLAQARVLEVSQDNGVRLEVRPADDPPFYARLDKEFDALSVPAVGSTVQVLYDAGNHDKVMIDNSGATAAPPAVAPATPAAPGAPPEVVVTESVSPVMGFATSKIAKAYVDKMITDPAQREMVDRAMADPLGFQKEMLEQYSHLQQGAVVVPGMEVREDPLDTIKKLADLHAKGVLTDEEFAEQKTKLLGET